MANAGQHGRGFSVQAILNRVLDNTNSRLATNAGGSGDNRPVQDNSEQAIWNRVFNSSNNTLRF